MVDLRPVAPLDAAVELPNRQRKARPPRRSKAHREPAKNTKLASRAIARIDADLSRTVDAITFLSRNEIDPATLIARISLMEAEAVRADLRKAVDWLNRFAEGWYVFTGNVEASLELENAQMTRLLKLLKDF
jgi:hypothetical protein